MTKEYDPLPTLELTEKNHYSYPETMPEILHLEDKALKVLIDFEKVRPAIAHPNDDIDETLVKMKSSGRLVMLVVDYDSVVGVVSSGDLQGEKPLKISKESGTPRSDIKVRSVMTPRKKLLCVNYQDFRFAKIGHLIRTLRENYSRYALVLDIKEDSDEEVVHGLINVYDIIKRLDKNLGTALHEARSIIELQKTMDQ